MKVAIFGGTFNPIHYGHLRAAEEVREKLGLDRVLFVPSGNPPLKTKDIAPARHRFAMVKLAVKDNRLFRIVGYREQAAGEIVYRQDNRGAAKRESAGGIFPHPRDRRLSRYPELVAS